MNTISFYLALGVIAGLAIALDLVFFYNRKERGLSWLAGLAFAFVIAGIFLGGLMVFGYSLMVVGVILAVIDIMHNTKRELNS
jgi:H+/Cl- antiporter ClcA